LGAVRIIIPLVQLGQQLIEGGKLIPPVSLLR
jgi:hypothetical protein